jgi:4a-hydroxytetrahydrobiopterin dehydratase
MLNQAIRGFSKLLTASQLSGIKTTIPHWSVNASNTHIQRTFEFENFKTAWEFMSKVADFAEAEGHHPEWFNVYGKIDVSLSTHDAGGVTELDT